MKIDVGTAAAPIALKSACFVLQFRLQRPAHQMRRTTTARARNFGDVTLSNVGFRGVLMKHGNFLMSQARGTAVLRPVDICKVARRMIEPSWTDGRAADSLKKMFSKTLLNI
jgi:hypothetical protein